MYSLRYRLPEGGLLEETELSLIRKNVKIKKGRGEQTKSVEVLQRSGLPQGLNFSPILASLALEIIEPPLGLVMFADDGVIIGNENTAKRWLSELGKLGISTAKEKTRTLKGVIPETFVFLGVEINLREASLKVGDRALYLDRDEHPKVVADQVNKWIKGLSIRYQEGEPKISEWWDRMIVENSVAHKT